jgi:alpha-L-rhamnosidase
LYEGANAIGVMLAEGWYAGYVGFTPRRNGAHYGTRPSFLGQIVLDFEGGGQQVIGTDERWRISLGPVEYSDMLMGERYDARRELGAWRNHAYDDSCWPAAVEAWCTEAKLVAERAQAMKIIEEIRPKTVARLESGACLFDLGQNMVGRIKLRVQGKAGSVIRIRHGEMLTDEQQLYTANLRTARAEDIYMLKGVGIETYEPTFTYHGFRYVEVTGLQEEPDLETVTGRVLMSATPRTGHFECSDQQVTQLYENILWGQKGNFISVPTDCPQRDERMGWTGDAQIFFATAAYNMDIAAFISKWMIDVEDAQRPDGAFTDIAPLILFENGGAPGWADAGIIIPWSMYVFYGDRSIIQRHWKAMTAFMEGVARQNPGFLRRHRLNLNFGDWLSIDADTPKDLLATAYYAYCAGLMADMARAIGRVREAEQYSALWLDIRDAFVSEFMAEDGAIAGDTQTAYALSLAYDLVPEKLQAACARKLVENIAARGGRLSCGFHGTRWLAPVLTRFGYSDIAYKLVLSEEYPSWGFSIKHGATTIWERWDGWTPEHGFQEQMNSFNHYAFGSIGQWLYGDLAGIKPDPARPGFKHILIAPQIRDGIEWCRAAFRSPHGRISVSWTQSRQRIGIDLEIPPNTTAAITLPVESAGQVTEGQGALVEADGIVEVHVDESGLIVTTGSGRYAFEIQRE